MQEEVGLPTLGVEVTEGVFACHLEELEAKALLLRLELVTYV